MVLFMNDNEKKIDDVIEESSITNYSDDIDDIKIDNEELIKKIINSIIKKEENKK